MHTGRLKGSAIPSAVMFSVLSMTCIAAVMLVWEQHTSVYSRMDAVRQADAVNYAARMLYCEAGGMAGEYEDSVSVVPFSDLKAEASITGKMHGLYELITVVSGIRGGGRRYSAVLAGLRPDSSMNRVSVKDAGRFLSIGDDCLTDSPLYVPGGRYRIVRGSSEARLLPDSADVRPGPSEMPPVSEAAAKSVAGIYAGMYLPEAVLSASDSLPDNIISASYIRVDRSFRNSVQLFATDSIVIESGAVLEWPSGVYVNSPDGRIRIEDGASVEGYVIFNPSGEPDREDTGLFVNYEQSDSSVVRGMVFIDGTAEIRGTVTGCIYVSLPVSRSSGRYSLMTISGLTQVENSVFPYPVFFRDGGARQPAKEISPGWLQ